MTRIQKDSIASSNRLFKKSALAICIAAVTAPAFAQDEPAEVEEVIVYGVKQSLSTAQDMKRDANTVKDIITASDIGALPDKSVVEALQRVPGVAIERFEASDDPDHFSVEGGNVTVRGLNRVRAEFNGRDAFSAGNDGGLNFSDIPPEMVGAVEVSKNQTASMIEGGIAGTVNLITRKPLDKDGLVAGLTVKGSYGDLIDEVTPSASFVISNTWDSDVGTFGALLSISGSNFTARGDGVGVYNYYGQPEWAGLEDQFGNPAAAPVSARVNQQSNDRDRLGIAGSLQWESPSEDILATLEFIRSDSTLAWNERFVENPNQPFSGDILTNLTNITLQDVNYNCFPESSVEYPCQFTSGTLLTGNYPWGAVPYTTGTRFREDERVINDISLNLQYQVTENLKITGDLQYTDASQDVVDNTAHAKFFPQETFLAVGGSEPRLEFNNTNLTSADEYFWRSAMDHISQNEGEQTAFAIDAEYTVEDSLLLSVKTGIRFSNREMEIRESDYNWGNVSETWIDGAADTEADLENLTSSGLIEQFTFDDHLSGNVLQNGNDTFWFPALSVVTGNGANASGLDSAFRGNSEFYRQLPGPDGMLGTADDTQNYLPAWTNLSNRDGVMFYEGGVAGSPLIAPGSDLDDGDASNNTNWTFLPSEIYLTEEDRFAAYVQFDFGDEDADQPWSGNIGFRYVDWQVESTGAPSFPSRFSDAEQGIGRDPMLPALDPSLTADQIAFADGSSGERFTVKGEKFSRVLPSFNIKYGINDDFILRFAASESIWLPTLVDLRNDLQIDGQTTQFADPVTMELTGVELNGFIANGGNPYLQPELASNYDLAFEYYFADVGSLTATLFYKRVRDFHRQASEDLTITNPNAGSTQMVENTSKFNAGTARVEGYELAYQTTFDAFLGEAFEDFGVQASYTKIDGEEVSNAGAPRYDDDEAAFRRFTGLPIEGLSKDNYNVVFFYDNETFQGRFAYSWRSEYLLNSRDVIAFSPVFGEATGQLDASFSYQINDMVKVGLEANNLLDEVTKTSIQYNQEGVQTPRSYFVNDRRFALFMQVTY